MAPPQVNLNEKKPAEGFVDPIVVHAPVPSAPPIKTADIAVDFGTPRCRKRPCASKRCKIIIASVVVLLALAITAAVALPLLHRRFAHDMDDVQIDDLHQRIIVARDGNGRRFSMMAILDYPKRAAGYRDMEMQICYIESPLQETFQQGCYRWRGNRDHHRRPMDRPLRVKPGGVNPANLRTLAGDAIADMCQDATKIFLVEAVPMPPMDGPMQDIQPPNDGPMDGPMDGQPPNDGPMDGPMDGQPPMDGPMGDGDSHEQPSPPPLPAGEYIFV